MSDCYELIQNAFLPGTATPAWHWICDVCGWKGLNLGSRESAVAEADRHGETHAPVSSTDTPRAFSGSGEFEVYPQ